MWDDGNPYQTMSITTPGPATLPKPEAKRFAVKNTNDIGDIDGAHSGPAYKLYTNKPQFLQSDVHGATSKQLCRGRNTRDNSLYIDDIEGTRKLIKDRMMRTNRHVDPLEPHYNLPSYATNEAPDSRFLRDAIDVSDIEGTRPKPKKEFSTRDIMGIADIEGSKPGLKQTARLNSIRTKNILDVEDICARNRYVDRTSRVSDPCAPSYLVNGMEIADGPGAKPRPQPKQLSNFLLMTKDISGAEAGSRYTSSFERTEVRNTNNISDIAGAHADSIKHSIVSTRQTNPLQPVYQGLDPGELLLPVIPPLVPPQVIQVPTVPPRIRAKPTADKPASHGVTLGGSWGHGEGDLDLTAFTTQPPSSRAITSSGVPPLGLSTVAGPLRSNPTSSRSTGNFNYTNYSNSNFNPAPYPASGTPLGSGRQTPLSKRAQAAQAADIAAVRELQ